MNAFHVMGGLFAVWAVTLTAIGIRSEDFPRPGLQTVGVGTISVLLAASAIGSGIVTSAQEDHDEEGDAAEGEGAGGGGRTLALSADPGGDLSFDTDTLEGPAGELTIQMENPSSVPHNVSIEGRGVNEEGRTVGQGGTSTVNADLRPGEYDFYCSVAGHRQAGMEGTLTVR